MVSETIQSEKETPGESLSQPFNMVEENPQETMEMEFSVLDDSIREAIDKGLAFENADAPMENSSMSVMDPEPVATMDPDPVSSVEMAFSRMEAGSVPDPVHLGSDEEDEIEEEEIMDSD